MGLVEDDVSVDTMEIVLPEITVTSVTTDWPGELLCEFEGVGVGVGVFELEEESSLVFDAVFDAVLELEFGLGVDVVVEAVLLTEVLFGLDEDSVGVEDVDDVPDPNNPPRRPDAAEFTSESTPSFFWTSPLSRIWRMLFSNQLAWASATKTATTANMRKCRESIFDDVAVYEV